MLMQMQIYAAVVASLLTVSLHLGFICFVLMVCCWMQMLSAKPLATWLYTLSGSQVIDSMLVV